MESLTNDVTLEKHLELLDQHREALEKIAELKDQLHHMTKVVSLMGSVTKTCALKMIEPPAHIRDQLMDSVWDDNWAVTYEKDSAG